MIKEKEITEQQNTFDRIYEEENFDNQQILINARKIRILNIWFVRILVTVLLCSTIISLIIPLRPTYSETEKRELTSFPKFSFQSLFSGKYFDGISEWFSDTFPFREELTDINAKFSVFYGKTNVQIHGDVENGDEIPAIPAQGNELNPESSSAENAAESVVEQPSAPESEQAVSSEATPIPPPVVSAQKLGALLINGDTAYEYYNFVRSVADSYSGIISRAAALTEGKANVYDIIVPTSMGITASDEILAGVNTSNQKSAIDYMNSLMSPSVKQVKIYDTLKNHKNEYVYFRTDHHWTSLGAYYAYCELMNQKGITPTALDTYINREFPGYLGSFYSISGKLPQLAANPDCVIAYQPQQTNSIHIQNKSGAWYDSEIITDMTASSASTKYLTFIKGDNPFSVINNPTLTDNSTCIVIKESFGNAFVPFLVSHYQNTFIVDYRYFSSVDPRGLAELRDNAAATDIIFINNISATRNKALIASLDAFVR